ncbi:hypothetical protein JIN84_21480 [Luteolibacter yonseiensis]|uniref:Uncharacterized protein n=1 Tax=Luteolibacter yonseiensis TaxID=1144680 RepID=A0A934VDJ3_9BACT|nr:hypothetical protein [Luteolibacter yonseiensis]MBK1818210.1 hypothetical protein [Luteolibacter yonseiensis]
MFIITVILIYMLSVFIIRGWIFAMLHRDGVTDAFEWEHDLEFAGQVALIAGMLGPVGVLFFWLVTDRAQHGWTLKPDQK